MSPVPDELKGTLDLVRSRIQAARRPGAHRMTEEDTKQGLINPVLRALGWDVEDVEQVRFEFKVKRMDGPTDYALLLRGTARLLIEAKAIGEDVDDDKWAGQAMKYAGLVGAPWIALTNGDRWKVYRAGVDLPLDEKLFRSIGVADGVHEAEQTLALLAREALQGSVIDEMWEEERVDRQVEKAVKEIFDPLGDLPVVSQIRRRTSDLSAVQVRASLSRARISIEFPKPPPPSPPPPPGPWRGGRVTVQNLIEAGHVKPPLELSATYFGKTLKARIEPDGRVRFGDRIVDSLSGAGALAKASIRGKVRGKLPATDGWTFWRFIAENGKAAPIDEMREALRRKPT